jgi:integrase
MVETKLLTAEGIKKLKPGRAVRWFRDSGSQSLFFVIQPSGVKSFMMRFRGANGRPAKMVLGRLDLSGHELKDTPEIGQPLSLAGARALAADIHRRRLRGEDVILAHKGRKLRERTAAATKATSTFAAAAIDYIRGHKVKRFGTRPRRWFEAARALGLAWPRHGDPDKTEPNILPGSLAARWSGTNIAEIDEADISVAIDGLPDGTKRYLLTALSGFFRYQHARRHVPRNPCRDLYRPAAPVARDRVLTADELRWLWRALDDEPLHGRVVKLLMLTGQRLNEVAGLAASELSDDRSTWTIGGQRTKNHRAHIVHLAPLAQQQLVDISTGNDPVFRTTGSIAPYCGSRLKKRVDRKMKALAKAEIPPWRFHDIRRSVVTGMAELGIRPDVIELCVNHQSGARGGVAGTYNRAAMLPERKQAFARWALHLAGIVEQRPADIAILANEKARRHDAHR